MLERDKLPASVEELKDLFLSTQAELLDTKDNLFKQNNLIKQKDDHISYLSELVRFFKRRTFKSSQSEVVSSEQLGMFNKAEEDLVPPPQDQESKQKSVKRKKSVGRRPLPKSLERETRVIDLSEAEKQCACCGEEMSLIGCDKSEQLMVIPAQYKVLETLRNKYACKNSCCGEGIKGAKAEPSILPGSMAEASLLAYLMVSKYCDHLPLYRLSGILSRFGVDVDRGLMARWMISAGEKLRPLYNLSLERLREGSFVAADETPVQVLKEPGRAARQKSYMWVLGDYRGPAGKQMVLYQYSAGRGGEFASDLLSGFSGKLQSDGYQGYKGVARENELMSFGCMAHARRKFHAAWEEVKKQEGLAAQGLRYFKSLYKIEEKARPLPEKKRLKRRQKESKQILNELKCWAQKEAPKVPKKSKLGQAFTYLLNQWPELERYVDHPEVNIDNNWIENKIRPFALGRKNWLFSNSVQGAESSSIIYSLIETAKANGLEPWAYLTEVMRKIPLAQTVDNFEDLLPLKK